MVELKLHKQKGAASHCAATKSRVRRALRLLYPSSNENGCAYFVQMYLTDIRRRGWPYKVYFVLYIVLNRITSPVRAVCRSVYQPVYLPTTRANQVSIGFKFDFKCYRKNKTFWFGHILSLVQYLALLQISTQSHSKHKSYLTHKSLSLVNLSIIYL